MKKENAKFQLRSVQSAAFFIAYIFPLFKRLFIISPILFLLSSCASPVKPQQNPEVGRSAKIVRLSQQLEASKARVIQTGQTIRIILPSDQIFNPHSANLTSHATRLLDTVSQLMVILENTSTQVAGYTDVEPSTLQNRALSARQAQVIADYLWSKGVDTRLLYSVGYGASKPSPGLPGNFANRVDRRIEIKFQYLPLLSSLVN